MTFSIMTWLDDGGPRLGIVDTGTGQLRQLWRLHKLPPPQGGGPEDQPPVLEVPEEGGATDLHALIRQLFLIGCRLDVRRTTRLVEGPCRQEEAGENGRCPKVRLVHVERTATLNRCASTLELEGANALYGARQLRKLGGGVSS